MKTNRYKEFHIKKVHEWGCIAQQHGDKYNGEYLQCQLCGQIKDPLGNKMSLKQFEDFLANNEVYYCDSNERCHEWGKFNRRVSK